MSNLLRLGCLIVALTLICGASTVAADTTRSVSVTGTATVKATPDSALISVAVVTEARTARGALTDNNTLMTKVFEAIKALGITEKDFSTNGVNLEGRYHYPKDGVAELVGYTARNGVTIRVRRLSDLGTVLDRVVSDGANRVSGISFCMSDIDQKLNEGRKAATENAREKARLLVEGAGGKLGKVRTIHEQGQSRYTHDFQPMSAARAESRSASVPVNAGEREIPINVSVTFDIE